MALLTVEDLHLHYRTRRGPVRAVDGVSFSLNEGETLAIVGESGCGKSSLAYSIIRILPRNVHRYDGSILFNNVGNLVSLDEESMRTRVRWRGIAIVFQGAMNALNPVLRIGSQISETLILHLNLSGEEAMERAKRALEDVGLPPYVIDRYPHELSGGMKQRVVIGMALVMRPKLVILDEPTSALDVMTQANIINLLKRLKRELNLSYLFITHDLALASELADRVAIMYAGRIVEIGSAEDIFNNPVHPYTQRLLRSVPLLRVDREPIFIPGAPPDLASPPPGCRFHPRCPFANEKCSTEEPLLRVFGENNRLVACHYAGEVG
ncbi:MAG: ABC transporter ATP-binding protein [Aigarchaeota archaeon]|nr:ABC transporter ATP-binding protein [Candidatus Pelearchaeum maunauluense]